jgi:hypothetical protein
MRVVAADSAMVPPMITSTAHSGSPAAGTAGGGGAGPGGGGGAGPGGGSDVKGLGVERSLICSNCWSVRGANIGVNSAETIESGCVPGRPVKRRPMDVAVGQIPPAGDEEPILEHGKHR